MRCWMLINVPYVTYIHQRALLVRCVSHASVSNVSTYFHEAVPFSLSSSTYFSALVSLNLKGKDRVLGVDGV